MSSDALKKYLATIPKVYNAEFNPVLSALLQAIAASDDELQQQIFNGKDQLFVRTATGTNLDIIGNSYGVDRPPTLGMSDNDFQELIPNLSLKPKQIKKAFYDTADVFWGPLFSRANITSLNVAPFNVSPGDIINISIDNAPVQSVKVLTGDIAISGSATATEMVNILSKIKNSTTIVLTDPQSGFESLNIRTNTPGSVGNIEFFSSTMLSPTKLDFPVGSFDILNLAQRVSIYNLNPNELIIELPAIIPALRRTLKGSHHFHTDSTLASPVSPADGTWVGSFFYNPSGSVDNFSLTGQNCILQQSVIKDNVYVSVAVNNTSKFLNPTGDLIFDFGMSTQEGPVKYRGIPNSNTLLIDPAYVFKFTHNIGSYINFISERKPYIPRVNGNDYAVYLTSPSNSRAIVQSILLSLAAAGIIIKFVILAPKYKYLLDNPYIDTDNANEIS
jgi:hypothetical protein